jgi:hypothetical protein
MWFVELVRSTCDLMHLFFVYDEYTDVMDRESAPEIADIVIDALRNPSVPRPPNECFLGELSRQYVTS